MLLLDEGILEKSADAKLNLNIANFSPNCLCPMLSHSEVLMLRLVVPSRMQDQQGTD